MEQHQPDDFKKDLKIYFIIIALLAVVLTINHLHLGTLGIALIVVIAAIEATVLAYFFMHLITKKKTIHLLLLLTLVVFANLIFWPAWDVFYSPRTPSEYTHY